MFRLTYPKVANSVVIHGSAQSQGLIADFHRFVDMGAQPFADGFRRRHETWGLEPNRKSRSVALSAFISCRVSGPGRRRHLSG